MHLIRPISDSLLQETSPMARARNAARIPILIPIFLILLPNVKIDDNPAKEMPLK